MKIKIVRLEIKFSWKKTKTKNQKQFVCNKASATFFYKKAKKIFGSVKKAVDVNPKNPKSLTENSLYSTSLVSCFVDNWSGLTPL